MLSRFDLSSPLLPSSPFGLGGGRVFFFTPPYSVHPPSFQKTCPARNNFARVASLRRRRAARAPAVSHPRTPRASGVTSSTPPNPSLRSPRTSTRSHSRRRAIKRVSIRSAARTAVTRRSTPRTASSSSRTRNTCIFARGSIWLGTSASPCITRLCKHLKSRRNRSGLLRLFRRRRLLSNRDLVVDDDGDIRFEHAYKVLV